MPEPAKPAEPEKKPEDKKPEGGKPSMLDNLLSWIGAKDPVAVAAQGAQVQATTCESLAAAPQNARNVQMQMRMGCKMDNGL